MATMDNLGAAFAGESQANRKYLAFAKKADEDGYPQVAKLFRAAAAAETVHAHAHLRAMDGIKSTTENLKVAIEGEGYESNVMYPDFVAEAEKEGSSRALVSFRNALAVEKIHFAMYGEALAAVESGKDLADAAIHVCDICGCTVAGAAPDKCPVCGAAGSRFFKVD